MNVDTNTFGSNLTFLESRAKRLICLPASIL